MTAASTDVLHGPGKLHPGCALSRTGRPYRKPRGEGGHADTAQWAKHWGDMPVLQVLSIKDPTSMSSKHSDQQKDAFQITGAGWLINLARAKSRPSRRRDKSPSHPWLARPTPAIMYLHAIGPMQISRQSISPSSPTDFDRPWQGARGAADRGQGGSQVPPLAPAGPRRADTRTGWLRDAVPVESDTFPVDFGREPRGVVVPSPEQYVPTELGVARLGHLTRGNSPSACPPKACPGLLCPRSGAGVRLTGSCQEQHPVISS